MENEEKKSDIKSYVIVKIPPKAEHMQKASDMLGTKKRNLFKNKRRERFRF